MPVLNTASPKVSPGEPKDSPRKVRPSSRTRIAGLGRVGAGSGTPYLLFRLTGRLVKGCVSTRTLSAAGVLGQSGEARETQCVKSTPWVLPRPVGVIVLALLVTVTLFAAPAGATDFSRPKDRRF